MVGAGAELENLTKKVLNEAVESLNQLQTQLHTVTGHENHQQHKP